MCGQKDDCDRKMAAIISHPERRAPPAVERRAGMGLHTTPQAIKTASIRSVWYELDCHVDALLAMTRAGGFRNDKAGK
jgi:hypothetical protein